MLPTYYNKNPNISNLSTAPTGRDYNTMPSNSVSVLSDNPAFATDKESYTPPTLTFNSFGTQKYGQRDCIGWVAVIILGGLLIAWAASYSNHILNPEAQRIFEENNKQTNMASLETSVNGEEDKLSEEDQKTLLGVIIASSIYNSNNSAREKTKDYSTKDYEELKAKLREKDIKVAEGEVYENEVSDREETKRNYNVKRRDNGYGKEAETLDASLDNEEFTEANPDEVEENVTEEGTSGEGE